eukprot:1160238-Pelagomonas_calceolata.AAC.2
MLQVCCRSQVCQKHTEGSQACGGVSSVQECFKHAGGLFAALPLKALLEEHWLMVNQTLFAALPLKAMLEEHRLV